MLLLLLLCLLLLLRLLLLLLLLPLLLLLGRECVPPRPKERVYGVLEPLSTLNMAHIKRV